jgi:hypothetical protein
VCKEIYSGLFKFKEQLFWNNIGAIQPWKNHLLVAVSKAKQQTCIEH